MSFLGAQNSIALGVQGLIHIDTGVVGSADYLLAKSLRFRSSASAYLNRTASATISTYTISMWVKRGTLGVDQVLFSYVNTGNSRRLNFTSTDTLRYFSAFVEVYRDPAAWYHIVASCESGALKWYVNGILVGAASASLSEIPSGTVMSLGRDTLGSSNYFDGEMAEVNFVDGQALTPTSFGASSTYNQWLPIKYAGAYGTNGFYLPFTNTTSTSTLVADSSGNANNWTPNNISLTAGSTYDSLTDVPTLTSETVANYAVLNPLDKGSTLTLSNANLTYATTTESISRATIRIPPAGKFYWESTVTSGGPLDVGVATAAAATTVGSYLGIDAFGWGYFSGTGAVYNNNAVLTTFSSSIAGDIIALAFNADAQTLAFYKNNALIGTLTGFTSSGTYFPAVGSVNGAGNVNFGQQPFTYTPPTGFLPLNTFNI